jgi:hypothetical protein
MLPLGRAKASILSRSLAIPSAPVSKSESGTRRTALWANHAPLGESRCSAPGTGSVTTNAPGFADSPFGDRPRRDITPGSRDCVICPTRPIRPDRPEPSLPHLARANPAILFAPAPAIPTIAAQGSSRARRIRGRRPFGPRPSRPDTELPVGVIRERSGNGRHFPGRQIIQVESRNQKEDEARGETLRELRTQFRGADTN